MTLASKVIVINDGKIQQIDKPQQIYDRPTNKFVASFVGSPAMNLFQGEIVRRDNSWAFQTGGLKMSFPVTAKLPESITGGRLILGIRPEHLHIATNDDLGPKLQGSVKVVEPMGSRTQITVECNGVPITVVTNNEVSLKERDEANMSLPLTKMHFFASNTEERID